MWSYRAGQARLQDWVMEQVDGTAYQLHHPAPPIAVLTGPDTKSAGEAVAIAFRGQANTRSFGQATAGLSSANSTYALTDGAALVLTVVLDADWTGRVYGTPAKPDHLIPDTHDGADRPLLAARAWLKNQPACRAPH